jgi:hypothetical protein
MSTMQFKRVLFMNLAADTAHLTLNVLLVEHERLTLPELTPDFSGIRAPQPLVLCVVFFYKIVGRFVFWSLY